MKVTLTLAAAATAFLLSGCARNTLSLEKSGRQLTPVFGEESEELVFINHVLFTKLEHEKQEDSEEILGYVAVTPAELVLGKGAPRHGEAGVVLKVALSELEGFAAPFGPYVQLAYQGERYVLFPYRWFTDTSDFLQVNELARLLHEQSVPGLEAWNVRTFDRLSYLVADTGSISFGDNPSARDGQYRAGDLYTDSGFYRMNGEPIDSLPVIPQEPLHPVQLDSSLNGTPPPYPEGRYPRTGQ